MKGNLHLLSNAISYGLCLLTGELRLQARLEFDATRSQSDPYAIKYALSNGREQLKQLQEMLAMAR